MKYDEHLEAFKKYINFESLYSENQVLATKLVDAFNRGFSAGADTVLQKYKLTIYS